MGNFISWPQEEEPVVCTLEEPREKEAPLDLSALPEKLFHLIVRKLNYIEYARLEETCKVMATALNNGDFSLTHPVQTVYVNKKTINMCRVSSYSDWEFCIPRVPWHVATKNVARIHVETMEIRCRASSSRMKAVTKLFERNKTTAERIQLMEHITFESEDLDLLIATLKVSSINCLQFLPRKFFVNRYSGLRKLEFLSCSGTGCTDEELFNLINIPELYLGNDFISDAALNKFLKLWKKGKIEMDREYTYFGLAFDTTAGTRNFDIILEGLDANPIWTLALHEHSLVAAINLEDFEPMKDAHPRHFYSLWDSDSPRNNWKLELSQSAVALEPFSREARDPYAISETSLLLRRLNDDQYYLVTKTCDGCGTEFCCHRRWYSTQRIKRVFPSLYRWILEGVKTATNVLMTVRLGQLLIGAPGHPCRLSTDDVKRIHFEEGADHSISKTVVYILRVYFLHQ